MKRAIPWVIAIGLLVLALAAVDSCRNALKDLKEMRDKYNAQAKETDELKATHDAERAAYLAEIAAREERETALEEKVAAQVAEIKVQKATIAALQAAEPVQPELEAEPLVINLRAQIREFSLALKKAEKAIEDQAKEIADLKLDKEALKKWGESWKADWEKEHALRLNAEANWHSVEKKYKRAQWGFSLKQLGWDAVFFGAGYFLGK
jgi:uncharacterized coiled-coil DUF342 family protein